MKKVQLFFLIIFTLISQITQAQTTPFSVTAMCREAIGEGYSYFIPVKLTTRSPSIVFNSKFQPTEFYDLTLKRIERLPDTDSRMGWSYTEKIFRITLSRLDREASVYFFLIDLPKAEGRISNEALIFRNDKGELSGHYRDPQTQIDEFGFPRQLSLSYVINGNQKAELICDLKHK